MKKVPVVSTKKERWDKVAILFILPYIVFCSAFMIYPTIMAIAGSVAEWNMITNSFDEFIGFDNYIRLFQDDEFWQSVKNSMIYFVVQIPTSILGGMFIASLLNGKFRGRNLFRGIYFLPIVIGSVVVSIIWKWMLQTSSGLINYFIEIIGFEGLPWLTSASLSMLSVSLVKAWMDIGYYTVIFLAAYQSISRDYVEAAEIDGATRRDIFLKIKLPLLNPTVVFCITMATIWAFQIFSEPYIMTSGGPQGSSTTMVLLLYEQGFTYYDLSYASTIGVVVSLLIIIVSIVENKIFKRDTD
ncbi:MAG: sugar ABC transporter permease [Eubacteriales bacterium]